MAVDDANRSLQLQLDAAETSDSRSALMVLDNRFSVGSSPAPPESAPRTTLSTAPSNDVVTSQDAAPSNEAGSKSLVALGKEGRLRARRTAALQLRMACVHGSLCSLVLPRNQQAAPLLSGTRQAVDIQFCSEYCTPTEAAFWGSAAQTNFASECRVWRW